MGVDPMISPYMRLAVGAWGKPAIDFVGDASAYRPWLNVPPALARFAHEVIDADFRRGNLFLTKPLRDALFVQTGERPSLANRAVAWAQVRPGG